MKLSPEDALRGTLSRFESRFKFVEKRLKENGKTPDQSDLAEMDRYWAEAKAEAKSSEAEAKLNEAKAEAKLNEAKAKPGLK